MGLFSGKTQIYVSSVMYNMAGDFADRSNYLRTLVIGNIFAKEPKESLGSAISGGTLKGPALDLRGFYRWANLHYTEGLPEGQHRVNQTLPAVTVAAAITPAPGKSVYVQSAKSGNADFSQWADLWVFQNHPERLSEAWTAQIDDHTNVISVIFSDITYTFAPVNFDPNGEYIYARYSDVAPAGSDTLLSSGSTSLPYASESALPDFAGEGYVFISQTVTSETEHATEIVVEDISYSDATPHEHNTSSTTVDTQTYTKTKKLYRTFGAASPSVADPNKLSGSRFDYFKWSQPRKETTVVEETIVETIAGGVTKTTVRTTSTESFVSGEEDWYYIRDEYEVTFGDTSDPKLFIYKYGSGNSALDALQGTGVPFDGFYPVIPLRIDNVPVSSTGFANKSKAAWKKVSKGGKISKLLDNIEDNSNIGDIDYATIVYGAPLNTKSNSSRRYIYAFLEQMMEDQTYDKAAYDVYLAQVDAYNTYLANKAAWRSLALGGLKSPEPANVTAPKPSLNMVHTYCTNASTRSFNMTVSWAYIDKTTFSGLGKAGAKKNDVWFTNGPDIDISESYYEAGFSVLRSLNKTVHSMYAYFQKSDTEYDRLIVVDFKHNNLVYSNKSIIISSAEAIGEEDEAGFIIPLHYGIMKSLPITIQNQMAPETGLIVFNCYVVKKLKWYQTGIFKILLVLAVIVVSAMINPGGLGAVTGILGTNAAVGLALGFSGVTAAILGAVANAIAAIVVSQLISTASTALFGEKLGALIGAIVGIVVANPSLLTGGAAAWSQFFSGSNLLNLTNSLSSIYTAHLNGDTLQTMKDLEKAQEEYEKRMKEIERLTQENLGSRNFDINPFELTDARYNRYEPVDLFLYRTLLTGSDIANLTTESISSFTATTVTTSLL